MMRLGISHFVRKAFPSLEHNFAHLWIALYSRYSEGRRAQSPTLTLVHKKFWKMLSQRLCTVSAQAPFSLGFHHQDRYTCFVYCQSTKNNNLNMETLITSTYKEYKARFSTFATQDTAACSCGSTNQGSPHSLNISSPFMVDFGPLLAIMLVVTALKALKVC